MLAVAGAFGEEENAEYGFELAGGEEVVVVAVAGGGEFLDWEGGGVERLVPSLPVPAYSGDDAWG